MANIKSIKYLAREELARLLKAIDNKIQRQLEKIGEYENAG